MTRTAITAAVALALCTAPASGQAAFSPDRTAEGRPDFQGVWATRFITRLTRPKEAETLEVSPEDARRVADAIMARSAKNEVTDPDFAFYGFTELAMVEGRHRTSQMVEPADGRIPYSEAGEALAERVNHFESYGFDNPEDRPLYERCLSGTLAAPIRTLPMLIPTQIVQTRDALVMRNEDVQGVRIIPMKGGALPTPVAVFDGAAEGSWDGDTLVVKTTGFRSDDVAKYDMGPPILVSPNTRVTERFTLIGPDELLYQYQVEDPHLYTMAWRAEFVFNREIGGAVHEYACHEGNYSMVNMLKAGRVDRQDKPPAK